MRITTLLAAAAPVLCALAAPVTNTDPGKCVRHVVSLLSWHFVPHTDPGSSVSYSGTPVPGDVERRAPCCC